MDVKKLERRIEKAKEALRAAKLKEKQHEQKKIVDLVSKSGLTFEQIEALLVQAKNAGQQHKLAGGGAMVGEQNGL
jgi:hypothetical protein